MNRYSWPRLASFEERLLAKRKRQMESTMKSWERFALLPLLITAPVLSALSFPAGHPEFIELIVFVTVLSFAIYGFCQFPGRPLALFLKRLDLKKRQIFRHILWRVRKVFRNFLQRAFDYQRFKDVPQEDGSYPNCIVVTSSSSQP